MKWCTACDHKAGCSRKQCIKYHEHRERVTREPDGTHNHEETEWLRRKQKSNTHDVSKRKKKPKSPK
jgi:hypothetical protein